MLTVLVGPTCSGKSTIVDFLKVDYGYKKVVTYTTRRPRFTEIDGVDYHFITDEQFQFMKDNGLFLEYADYNAEFGHVWYGSCIHDEDFIGDKVIILNPKGAEALKEKYPNWSNIFIVFLDYPPDSPVLLDRAQRRGDSASEFQRRIIEDEERYFGPFRAHKIYDFSIVAPASDMHVSEISKMIVDKVNFVKSQKIQTL